MMINIISLFQIVLIISLVGSRVILKKMQGFQKWPDFGISR